jgi:hypothetical protein
MKYRRLGYIFLFIFHGLPHPQIFIAEEFHMSSVSSLVVISALALACWVLLRQKRRQYKYPPGPSPKPIIGNALDVPAQKPWITYMKWSKELNSAFAYCFPDVAMLHFAPAGTILGLKTMNMNMIVLHKIKDAEMLLEKRSSIYSDRPVLPIVKL